MHSLQIVPCNPLKHNSIPADVLPNVSESLFILSARLWYGWFATFWTTSKGYLKGYFLGTFSVTFFYLVDTFFVPTWEKNSPKRLLLRYLFREKIFKKVAQKVPFQRKKGHEKVPFLNKGTVLGTILGTIKGSESSQESVPKSCRESKVTRILKVNLYVFGTIFRYGDEEEKKMSLTKIL